MGYKYDKDELKESLTIEQIYDLVAHLGGEPQQMGGHLTCRTICHNPAGEGSRKLYYYNNTKLFKCFTDCGDTFDIYELVLRAKSIQDPKASYDADGNRSLRNWNLPESIEYVAAYFNLETLQNDSDDSVSLEDWKILNNYERIANITQEKQTVELKIYEDKILQHLPRPLIEPWLKEGITQEVMQAHNIAYNPKSNGIIIPHYDIENRLIGIRERTLVKEEEVRGKYRPSIINGKMYNHPLSFNLYNLNRSKENIALMQKAILFEGEKSPLLYASYFGLENDITVASCGSSFIQYQFYLLVSLGVKEIIIAFDKQFKEVGDSEWKRWTKKLADIHLKYGSYVQISYMFDLHNLLGYKDSPIDKGPDVFMQLFKERIYL